MTRSEAIAIIAKTLPSLDEQQALQLAEVAQSMVRSLQLTAEDRRNVERARDDFKAGRTYSSSEARALSADLAAKRRSTPTGS